VRRARGWIAALALGCAYLAPSLVREPVVGLWQDDAVYLATARSLASGTGYRHVEIPGEPYQTKYPVLYPALLAGVFLLRGAYPDNLPWLLAPGAWLAGGFVVLSVLYARRVLAVPRATLAATAALAALAPEILSLSRFAMSDLPYACLSLAALWCLDARGSDTSKSQIAAAGLWIGAALLTRSFGLTLAVAAAVALLRERRPADALRLGAWALLAVLPWWLWQAWAAQANGAAQTSAAHAYDLAYGVWLPDGPGEALRVASHNALRAVFGLGFFQLALPAEFALAGLRGGSWRTPALHAACWSLAGLAALGFAASARRGLRTLHVYALAYAGALLVWPFEPYRFLVCWTPFLILFELEGVRVAAAWLSERVPALPHRLPAAATACAAAALLAAFVAEDARILASRPERPYVLRRTLDRRDHPELVAWLRAHTRPGEVLASNDTGDLFLAVGRQLRDTSPGIDPTALFYGRDRRLRDFTALPAPSETRHAIERVQPHLAALFSAPDVALYVERAGDERATGGVRRFAREHPGWLEPVFATRHGGWRVFRVHPAGAAP
jgi:hypothetical protein